MKGAAAVMAAREISKHVKPDYVVIGEASQLNIKIGQRGRVEIVGPPVKPPMQSDRKPVIQDI